MNIQYSPKVGDDQKDNIISDLKARVFELEQNEKNYTAYPSRTE